MPADVFSMEPTEHGSPRPRRNSPKRIHTPVTLPSSPEPRSAQENRKREGWQPSSINESMDASRTTRLAEVVKEQIDVVRSLTAANNTMRYELDRMKSDNSKLQEQLRLADEAQARKMNTGKSKAPLDEAKEGTAVPSKATALTAPEPNNYSENGSWVEFGCCFNDTAIPDAVAKDVSAQVVPDEVVNVPFPYSSPLVVDVPAAGQSGLPPPVAAAVSVVHEQPYGTRSAAAVKAARKDKSRKKRGVQSSHQISRRDMRHGDGAIAASDPSLPPPPPPRPSPPPKYAPPLPEKTRNAEATQCSSVLWRYFAFLCTFFVPNCLICREGSNAKQAWREKVALCVLVVCVSALFVGVLGFVPLYFCQESETYSWQDIWSQKSFWSRRNEAWTVIHGTIYDVKDFIGIHPGGSGGVTEFLGKDASRLFPRTPPAELPNYCLNYQANLTKLSKLECREFTKIDELIALPCHTFVERTTDGNLESLDTYKIGTLAHPWKDLTNSREMDWIVLFGRVYNVTAYVDGLREKTTGKIAENYKSHQNAYLTPALSTLIVNSLNQDATDVFEKLYVYTKELYLQCLDDLYYIGVVDDRYDPACHALNIIMYFCLSLVLVVLCLQCMCSLLYLCRRHPTFTVQDDETPVMIMVPCYNEGDKELRKTIDSILNTVHPDESKVMLIVADGKITGKGENKSTPETLANILGFDINKYEDESYEYRSIGALRENKANVYSGTYKKGAKSLRYIVLVKCGIAKEQTSSRAGNRGKRDSQLIVAGLLNRVQHNRELCDLDKAISRALNTLELPAHKLQYLMTVDADTRIDSKSISFMVHSMHDNENTLALCGETRVENKTSSLISMIQVYEYYTSHHMKKAFESVCNGTVTCLPGCFTLYRIYSNDGRSLIAADEVFSEYARNDIESLHEKNLYHLGEDRMLTTLLLKNFPDMRLSFVPEATCWTIVPHSFWVLLSQRRRWINSTFHNMWELLQVQTMCGVCFFSMKTVVIIDMISTMILPASMIYAVYFIYLVFVTGEQISTLLLILYGIIIGAQCMVFILRSDFAMVFWFLLFIVFGFPIFYFVLPLYSFWHQDDLSWGSTRQVDKVTGGKEMNRSSPASGPKTHAANSSLRSHYHGKHRRDPQRSSRMQDIEHAQSRRSRSQTPMRSKTQASTRSRSQTPIRSREMSRPRSRARSETPTRDHERRRSSRGSQMSPEGVQARQSVTRHDAERQKSPCRPSQTRRPSHSFVHV